MTLSILVLGDRRVQAVGAGLLVTLGLCTATGAAHTLAATGGLRGMLPVEATASVSPRSDGAASLIAPAGTALRSPLEATLIPGGGGVRLDGAGEDSGVTVVVSGLLGAPAAAVSVHRGDPIGAAGPGPLVVAVLVGGHPVEAAPLLLAGRDGDAAGRAPIRPVRGAILSQGFGCTAYAREPVDPTCPGGHVHSGVDLAAPLGTPVQAMLGGAVTVIRSSIGYGLHVLIDHGGGLVSLYGHLDSVTVASGDVIETGGVLGTLGSSGNSSGPHLHFELRRDGVAIDPRLEVALP